MILPAFSIDSGYITDTDVLSSGIARIEVFFEDLKSSTASETENDMMTSLVSDLGGQLGLWLGVSIISLMELIQETTDRLSYNL